MAVCPLTRTGNNPTTCNSGCAWMIGSECAIKIIATSIQSNNQ